MKEDPKTGKIAYHVYRMREGGGLDYVQYDFDGNVENITNVRPDILQTSLKP